MRRLLLLLLAASAFAQPATPPTFVAPKRIPPPGITLTDGERATLAREAAALRAELASLATALSPEPALVALLPDVEVLLKAVETNLRDETFYTPKEITFARHLLELGRTRAAQLRQRQTPWLTATGLVLRGHRSKLDGSVQPYGLFVPPEVAQGPAPRRLLVWLLGRGEKRTELAFLAEREAGPPQITPASTMVLVPYGRFCNATKFAGEVDVMEALAAVRAQYPIDPLRIGVAGFSMGGGSTWHLATHFPGLWCVASPGAGFAETPVFTKALAPGKEPRTAWEQLLWRQYDSTLVAANLFNVPTLAYAGELDGQKEASALMEAAMAREGLRLERFLGPQTAHKYHDETKSALTRRIEQEFARGRTADPAEVRFSTVTLRYPEAAWVRLEGLGRHWERADVTARRTADGSLEVATRNVTALTLRQRAPAVRIDGQSVVTAATPASDPIRLVRTGDTWAPAPATAPTGPRKRPGLTGPVNDAFLEPFLFVRPSGKPLHAATAAWVEAELTAARQLWREVYRGEIPVRADTELTDAEIAAHNLVLWGDPSSNAVLRRILGRLPLQWDARTLALGGQTYPADQHAPILVFPNPLNPARYVVLNSGIDFRAEGSGNNALQTSKLPDWAVVDLRTPPGPRWPGQIAAAGFFDEEWR